MAVHKLGTIEIPQQLRDEVYNTEPNRVKSQKNTGTYFVNKYVKDAQERENLTKRYDDHNCYSIAWRHDWYKDIIPQTFLDEKGLSKPFNAMVRLQHPGSFFAPHKDMYNVVVYGEDGEQARDKVKYENIARLWIPMEDGRFGEAFFIEDTALYKWKAGEVYTFPPDALHSSANAGMKDRHTLLVYCEWLHSKPW
tara:strand:+ start:2227 stop:2811 length:585 start_codon:yes stop_codon:yes gene_type:complete